MKITDILENAARLNVAILESQIKEELRDCGCSRCKKILKAMKQK